MGLRSRRRAWGICKAQGTHALVIGELVVSDVDPTAFVRALHPHRRKDRVHRRVPHVEHRSARTSGTATGSRGARRGSVRRPGALPCTAEINRTSHQSRNLQLAQSAKWTRCIRTSYTGGVKGRRHKGQRSTVRSMETLGSSLVGSCSVCMISPSSCTTISHLGRGITKLYHHIFYTLRIVVLPHTKEGSSLSFLDKFAPAHE